MIDLLAKFAPPKDAPPSIVRRTGARNALLGAFLFVFGVLLVLSLDRLAKGALLDPTAPKPSKLRAVSGVPVVVGFVAMVVGVYRVVTGIHPSSERAGVLRSALRIFAVACLAAALIALIVASAIALERSR